MLYMVSTPSPHTKEGIKVRVILVKCRSQLYKAFVGMEGNVGL